MSDETATNGKQHATITLWSEDGRPYTCELLGVFEFEHRDYALLLRQDASPNAATVLMRVVVQDDQSIFQTIESDEEFAGVSAHVRRLAEAADADS
jgi:hypothetical protein